MNIIVINQTIICNPDYLSIGNIICITRIKGLPVTQIFRKNLGLRFPEIGYFQGIACRNGRAASKGVRKAQASFAHSDHASNHKLKL